MDIGLGIWTSDLGFSPHLERTSDTYINYFKNLSELDNDMVIFTSCDLKPKIEKIRNGKRTVVIPLDINKKFQHIKTGFLRSREMMSLEISLKLAN
ncbi:WlaTC/HtrL family glycosyltransferase [Citrobacter werkmanii]|uniref:WlaTC/HtrL family glycosyltransferase n=1 Tax=Citrobacter werkmanii TaxID=67827 RepID=UPI002414298F|nr:WlaTC/HtrL family glycosyltransferase [Citrobacter werkmanii]